MKRGATVFFGVALLCTVAVSRSVAAQAPEPNSNKSPTQSMMIAIPVDYESQIPGSLILAESVRKYAGALSDVPIRIFIPSGLALAVAALVAPIGQFGPGTANSCPEGR